DLARRRPSPGSLRPSGPPGPLGPPGSPGVPGGARRPAGNDVVVRTLLHQRQQPHNHVVSPRPGRPAPPSDPVPAAPAAPAAHSRAPAPPPGAPQPNVTAAKPVERRSRSRRPTERCAGTAQAGPGGPAGGLRAAREDPRDALQPRD